MAQHLELTDLTAERLALFHVALGPLHRNLGSGCARYAGNEPFFLEIAHDVVKAHVFFTDHGAFRNLAIVEE